MAELEEWNMWEMVVFWLSKTIAEALIALGLFTVLGIFFWIITRQPKRKQ